MNAIDKEKVFAALRNYHVHTFPKKFKTETMTALRAEFEVLEDKIINMILSLVNGKAVFLDATPELERFHDKVKRILGPGESEAANRELFEQKVTELAEMMAMAHSGDFKLSFKLRRAQAAQA